MENNKKRLFHLHFSDLTENELMNSFAFDIENNKKSFVCTPNLDGLRMSYYNLDIRKAINTATYVTIDGKIVHILSKLFHAKIKNKFSGSDMADPVFKLANEKKYRVYLFGGKEGVAETAAKNIKDKYPDLVICGTYCPPFGFENNDEECKKIISNISDSSPNIVLLCCGFPKTEKFYFKYKDEFPNAIYLLIGATIDFIAGNIKRAPKWMSACGLEWLYRLSKDFKRLFKRYFLDFTFLIKLLFYGIFRKKKLRKMYLESLM